jgi:DNA polymerase-1
VEQGEGAGPPLLVLIDGNSLLYRAFFALPPLTNAKGEMTNAVYGFTTMLLKVLEGERPDMIAVAFDLPGPTFRHQQFADYKATRPKTPDELAAQLDTARELLEAMRIPAYDYEGYEADDVIGTLAAQAEGAGQRVLIVTGDLDELQLVSDKVSVMVTRRGITDTKVYDVAAVQERYGFSPDKLPDFRALRGDTTDNIPGVPGIGEKTAADLIKRFGTLDEVLGHAEEVTPPRVAAALQAYADLARQAHRLSTIVRDLPLKLDRDQLAVRPPDRERLLALFRRLDFRSLAARLEASAPVDGAAEAGPTEAPRMIGTTAEAGALARRLLKERQVVVHPLADEGPGLRVQMRGLCVLSAEGAAVVTDGSALDDLLAALKPALESPGVSKVGHDLKRLALLLSRRGIALQGMSFDTMVASYLANPSRRAHDLATAVYDHLGGEGGGTESAQLALESPDEVANASAALKRIAKLQERLTEVLREREEWGLFTDLEMPLVPVLLDMELAGVAVDSQALAALSERLGQRIRELEAVIHALAGEQFTISSPKQLQAILFNKLGLPPDKSKRTKTGYSTDAEVLGGLAEHEIVSSILEYREITKLKSTYVDVLPRLVDPVTGRLHTSFNQAVAATGRLSSSDPNLQNIPVRTDLGGEIRRAFVCGWPGWVLLSADYSQIELRILAHITQDANLIEIFRRDEDLHRAAAMEIFGVGHEEVTPAMRAFAKMVNFGIPYGISEFRLSREMGITVEEAHQYVQRYFARFPQLHAYVRETPERAREMGYVTTLYGRRRYLPELRTRAPAVRAAAERMAINTPMQGSAADIIKLAMLRVHERLRAEGLTARMILQVHDELLLEVPERELQTAGRLVAECMSGAYQLVVPLKVDLKWGRNWLDMEALGV